MSLFTVDYQRKAWLRIKLFRLLGQSYQKQWDSAVRKHYPNNIEFCKDNFFRLCKQSFWKWITWFN